jgi:maltose/maltodextrin transport system substrate-binding protein
MPNIPQMGAFWSAMESALATITSLRAAPQAALDNAVRRMRRGPE